MRPTCFLVDSSTMAMRWDTFLDRVSRLVAPDAPAVMKQQQQSWWHSSCCVGPAALSVLCGTPTSGLHGEEMWANMLCSR